MPLDWNFGNTAHGAIPAQHSPTSGTKRKRETNTLPSIRSDLATRLNRTSPSLISPLTSRDSASLLISWPCGASVSKAESISLQISSRSFADAGSTITWSPSGKHGKCETITSSKRELSQDLTKRTASSAQTCGQQCGHHLISGYSSSKPVTV